MQQTAYLPSRSALLSLQRADIFRVGPLTLRFRNGQRLSYRCEPALTVKSGSLTLITGANGCGKSSLMAAMGGLLPCHGAQDGLVYLDPTGRATALTATGHSPWARWRHNQHLARIRRDFAFLPQHGHLVDAFSIAENVTLAKRGGGQHALIDLLRKVELPSDLVERGHQSPAILSGGQAQRIVLARALWPNPRVIFADEPTTHLDAGLVSLMLDLLLERAAAGAAVILITHDTRWMTAQLECKLPALAVDVGTSQWQICANRIGTTVAAEIAVAPLF